MVETSPCVALLFCLPLWLIAPTNPIVYTLADAYSDPLCKLFSGEAAGDSGTKDELVQQV